MTTTLVAVMIVLLLLGFPMMIPLIAAAMVGFFFYFSGINPEIMIQQMVGGVKPVALIAVPMFIFAADIVTKGHAADRLLDLVLRFVGHLRGGLAITTAASCTLFGAVSGSTQATVVAIGGPLRPKMLKAGYTDAFTIALTINASDIALLIPPSIGMIIYGVVAGASIGELFIAGIGPGLFILLMFSVYCWIAARFQGVPVEEKATWALRWQAIKRALLPLGFPVIIVGGIYTGIFSPTEAAAISVLYAFLLEVVIFRSVKLSEIPDIAMSTGLITAVVFILVAAGTAFSWTISFAMIPQQILGGIGMDQMAQWEILAIIAVSFFVGCMFVDPIVVILILVPLFKPYVQAAGIDPILVGVIVTLQAAIGSATPPFGCDIFTAIAVFRRPYLDVIKGTPPFIVMLAAVSVLLIVWPELALFLRDVAFGY
ncbi:TRAP transporter large permease [Ferruginivarius sediminum]|uniref:TRAP transporter large permease protein n=1 Tax=Ferruginivarius sediminum TaxID=2661937 RepID=A0A369TBE6_9PROT|nr:TRAP transporter large permease [Ferruginivarius sediminum]RDD61834.1 TRAP transporter large permease [Ferruginivarius sediminum]